MLKAARLSSKVEDLKPVVQEIQQKLSGKIAVSFKLQQFRTRGFPSPGFPRFGFFFFASNNLS